MGYAMLHEYGANTETPFFTPTGPLLRCLPAKRLPFAVRSVSRFTVRIRYIVHRSCLTRSLTYDVDTVLL